VCLIVVSSREAYATTEGPAKCYAGGSFDMAKTKIADTASKAASASCTKFCMNETKADGTEFKCAVLPTERTINTCVTENDVKTCYCDTDDCNGAMEAIKCYVKEGTGEITTKTEKTCQKGIVNCKQVKTMANGAETKRELFCGNTDETKLGCTNNTDGTTETCFCKEAKCNTGSNTWPVPNSSSPRQLVVSNLVILFAFGVALLRKCE